MALRNAFDNLGTESALRRIASMLNFARTSSDQLRVIVDNQQAVSIYSRNSSTTLTNSTLNYNDAAAWNAVDARDPIRQQYRANANFTAKNRWTY
jgi:hypothetical protein